FVANGGRVQDSGNSSGSVAVDGVYDAMQSGIGRNATTSGSGVAPTINVSHTVAVAGTNTLLLVGISATGTLPTAMGPVIWDLSPGSNQALTSAGFTTGTSSKVWIYYLKNPSTTGAAKTLQVSLTGGGTVVVGVMSFTGVDQTTPLGTFFGAASNGVTASVNVSSGPREVVFDTVAVDGQTTSLS